MRSFSKVYSNVWASDKFNALTENQAKLAYLYLLTSPHSNSSGCFNIKLGYAMSDLGYSEHDYRMAMDSLSKVGLIEVETGSITVLITNWVEFNEPTNAKHALGVMTQLNTASSENLKIKRAQEFIAIIDAKKMGRDNTCGSALERLCLPYREAIHRASPLRPKTETQTLDREGDLDQTRPETREEVSHSPLRAVAPSGDGLAAQGIGEAQNFPSIPVQSLLPELPDIPLHLNRLLNTNLMKRTGT